MKRENWKLPPGRLIRISPESYDKWLNKRGGISKSNRHPVCDWPILDCELPPSIVKRAAELTVQTPYLRARTRFWDVSNAQWIAIREYVFERDGYCCVYCGALAEHADHLIPISKFGSWHPDNVVASCASCNCSKCGNLLEEWSGPKDG